MTFSTHISYKFSGSVLSHFHGYIILTCWYVDLQHRKEIIIFIYILFLL